MDRYSDLEIEKPSEDKAKKDKKTILIILYLFMSFNGITSELSDGYSQLKEISDFIFIPLLSGVSFAWCMYDAKCRGVLLGSSWGVGFILLAPIIMPLYFYKTYGVKRGTKKILLAYLTLFLAMFVSVLSSAITVTILNT